MRVLRWAFLPLCLVCASPAAQGGSPRDPKTSEDYIKRFEKLYTEGDKTDEDRLKYTPGPKCLGDQEIPTLIRLAQSPVWEAREWAVQALGRLKAKDAVELIIARLADEKGRVREAAAFALGAIGDARAVEPLLAAAGGEGYERANAAKALGMLGDARAVPVLIQCLVGKGSGARREVAWALGRLGDKSAVEPLIGLLRDPDMYVRRDVAEALGLLKDARAVEALLALLQDKEAQVREMATEALGRIGDKQVLAALMALLRDDPDARVRAKAADALGRLGDNQAAPALAKAMDENSSLVQARAALSLHRLGDKRGMPFLIAALGKGEAGSSHPACTAVKELGVAALPELLPLLADPGNDLTALGRNLLDAVEAIGAPAGDGLLKVLREGNEHARRRAMYLLARLKEPRAVDPLVKILVKEEKGWPAIQAASALGAIGKPATKALVELLGKGTGAAVREHALIAAGHSDDVALVKPLLKLVGDSQEPIRLEAVRALRNKDDKDVPPALEKALKDASVLVRQEAARCLGYRGDQGNIAKMKRAAKEEKDPQVIDAIKAAIEQIEEKGGN